MSDTDNKQDLQNQLWGWGLFVACAVLFILSGVRAGDILTITASVLFLLACMVFIKPLVKAIRQDNNDS
jgi:choline-glycine betaine transporter